MKIAFITESGFTGKVPRNFTNTRTETAWQIALDAVHHPFNTNIVDYYDLIVTITPKKNPLAVDIQKLKNHTKRVAVMQEGPAWYFQDYPLENQIHYFNNLVSSDIIFVHNEVDKKYYSGLTNHKHVHVLPSLMIEDTIIDLPVVERSQVIMGGNFCSWYGGYDSFMISREFGCPVVHAPSMGRKIPNEDQLVTHLPYLNWSNWIKTLNQFKYGVHLMRTHAAGTFALNCAYLGIPCIGYTGLDTQMKCHPLTTVSDLDLESARNLARKLRDDVEFYKECSQLAKSKYKELYTEEIFVKYMNGILS